MNALKQIGGQVGSKVSGIKEGVKGKINQYPKAAAITMIALGCIVALAFVGGVSAMTVVTPLIMLVGGGLVIGSLALFSNRNNKVARLVQKITPIVVPIIFAMGVGTLWAASMMVGGPLATGFMGVLFYAAIGSTAALPLWITQFTIPEMLKRRKSQRAKGPSRGVVTPKDPQIKISERPSLTELKKEASLAKPIVNAQADMKKIYGDDFGTQVNFKGQNLLTLRNMSDIDRQKETQSSEGREYIFWLFPVSNPSAYFKKIKPNEVPQLTPELQKNIIENNTYRQEMGFAFTAMLKYYGLTYDATSKKIDKGDNWSERSEYWLCEKSREFVSLAVMIESLSQCNFKDEAVALTQFLMDLKKTEAGSVIPSKFIEKCQKNSSL